MQNQLFLENELHIFVVHVNEPLCCVQRKALTKAGTVLILCAPYEQINMSQKRCTTYTEHFQTFEKLFVDEDFLCMFEKTKLRSGTPGSASLR